MTTDSKQTALPPVHEAWLPREHPLHRPRHGRRQVLALVCAALFFLTPLMSLLFGVRPGEFENRALAAFPGPLSGWSFFTGLVPWASDHLPFREQAIKAGDALSRGLFNEPPALGSHGQHTGPIPQDQQPKTPSVSFPSVIEGKGGWLYLGAEAESHCKQSRPFDQTLAALRKLRDGVEASGRTFVVVLAPDKATIVPEHLPDSYIGKACHDAMVQQFWRTMSGEGYVVDLRGELKEWERKLTAPVYGPLDAHWSDEGGLSMARALAERVQPGVTSGWVITPGPAWQDSADIPPLIGRTGTSDGRHYAVKPDGQNDLTHPVTSNFVVEPVRLNTATGPGTCQQPVALFSDSFTYRAMPYLAAAFGNMTVVHQNLVKRDDGATLGDQMADNRVVAIEVAERSLIAGDLGLLGPAALNNILHKLAERPLR
jgi:alginate O-acetyltransferase complex protein AlgJ